MGERIRGPLPILQLEAWHHCSTMLTELMWQKMVGCQDNKQMDTVVVYPLDPPKNPIFCDFWKVIPVWVDNRHFRNTKKPAKMTPPGLVRVSAVVFCCDPWGMMNSYTLKARFSPQKVRWNTERNMKETKGMIH